MAVINLELKVHLEIIILKVLKVIVYQVKSGSKMNQNSIRRTAMSLFNKSRN